MWGKQRPRVVGGGELLTLHFSHFNRLVFDFCRMLRHEDVQSHSFISSSFFPSLLFFPIHLSGSVVLRAVKVCRTHKS